MTKSYASWPLEKLKKERLKIDQAIKMAEKRDKKATLAKMATIARQNGFELHELMSDLSVNSSPKTKGRNVSKAGKPRGNVQPKYCHPQDASQTWTGRGRQPLWIKELLEGGSSLEDLQISAPV